MHTAKKILLVRPAKFAYNEQTAKNNFFQGKLSIPNIHEKALEEFDNFVSVLRSNKIDVVVVQDTIEPHTPDSIFPNNWFSTHLTGELVLYPMFAENRRAERKAKVISVIEEHFSAHKVIDLTEWESKNRFLEGTGSLILDHNNRIAYACRSERTDDFVFEEFYTKMNFEPQLFNAHDENGNNIYHTNLMLSIGEKFAVICGVSITDKKIRSRVIDSLKRSKKEVIEISFEQMNSYCANILEVLNSENESCLIMSDAAKHAFTTYQKKLLEKQSKIISSPLHIIEHIGGGSARCMIAEIF
ncbi:MAG: arginine deiminase-related protein [Dysgonamonadaceae bacterium]|nr:arginine deiminase-related protein [Dysgonamonadaceae bacterium]MDD4729019.1 arginine deiminase-related protein [Dysgonamonadaceae bacterium]